MEMAGTPRTPEVKIDSSNCSIKGECYPEDISEFSGPVMEALRENLSSSESFTVTIELYYFNSSSAKFLFDFFEYLDQAGEEKQIRIIWKYRSEDDAMEEAGSEFEEDMENVSFSLEAIN